MATIFELEVVKLSCRCAHCGADLCDDVQACVCKTCLFAYCCEHVTEDEHDCDEATFEEEGDASHFTA